MDRAAWRRIQFMNVEVYGSGVKYTGPLSFLKVIVDYLQSHERVTHTYGISVKKDRLTGAPVRARVMADWEKTEVD